MNEAAMGGAEPRSVDAGRGLSWWTDAWALFTKSAGMWIVLGLILLVIFVVLAFIPLLGSLATSLLAPVFVGSWLLAARKVEGGGNLEVGDLFAAFQTKTAPLLVLGALMLVATLVIGLVVGALGVGAAMGIFMGGAHQSAGGMMAGFGAGMLALLIGLALGFVVAMAIWFAPALVVFRDVAPIEALKASFAACLKNIVPFLLYGVLYIVAAIVASIPFGLGWIVLLPLLLLTVYVSYQDVFGT
ncbi:MAG TPA: BPSS1780 family membrane protein [Burkholderiaceae bacterium]|nr:BPSS1780 family membrane protein [Burkholderiaceae bacterium]